MVGRDHTEVIEKPHGGGEMDFYRGEKFSFFFFYTNIISIYLSFFMGSKFILTHLINRNLKRIIATESLGDFEKA